MVAQPKSFKDQEIQKFDSIDQEIREAEKLMKCRKY